MISCKNCVNYEPNKEGNPQGGWCKMRYEPRFYIDSCPFFKPLSVSKQNSCAKEEKP